MGSRVESPSRGDGIPAGLDPSEVLTTIASKTLNNFTESSWNASAFGPRGDTWLECTHWFEVMPGALFQLGNLFLFFAFMAGGSSETAASFTHFTSMVAFSSFAVWGYLDACSLDIMVWGIVIAVVNLIQVFITCRRSNRIQDIMGKDGMGRLYDSRFAPFGISPQLFVELVTCKGCEITHMDAGQNYAQENTTPIDRVSLLLSGRMKVLLKGNFLHYITADNFIDSPEWFADGDSSSVSTFKTTIVSDSTCTFISWKRKELSSLLTARKRLGKIFKMMLGTDVARKLYCLNDRCINERGFRYDIRLPCVMSLPQDVERRKRAAAVSHSAPGTPGMEDGRRHKHKKLGKTAQAKYAKMFANKLRARVSMRAAKRPVVPVRREPLKEED